jgi:hypothetical protein
MRLIRQYRTDTAILLGKAILCIALVTSFVFLINMGTQLVRSVLDEPSDRDHDQRLLARLDGATTLEEQIARRQEMLGMFRDKKIAAAERKELAVLYDREGQQFLSTGNLLAAEENFHNAKDLDPKNPDYCSELAQLYAQAALNEAQAPKFQLLRNSEQSYEDAANRASDSGLRQKYSYNAASQSFNLGQEELKVPDSASKAEGLSALQKAKSLAPPGSPLAQQADDLLSQYSRR